MSQAPTGEQQAMSKHKRPREGETCEPYKRAQGLEYPDMGANVEDNAYPQRDTTEEMLPNLSSWNTGSQGLLRVDNPSIGIAMPMNNVSTHRSKALEQESKNLEVQQYIGRSQVQPVSRKAKTPMAYDQPVPQPSEQVQPHHAARAQTPNQAQAIQSSLPTPTITPRRKPKKKGPAGKSAQAGGPNEAPMAPSNAVYEFGLPNEGSNQTGHQTSRSPYTHQHIQAQGVQTSPLQQQTPPRQQVYGKEQPSQQSIYGQPPQQPYPQSPNVSQQKQDTSFQNGFLQQQTPYHQQARGQQQPPQQPVYGQQHLIDVPRGSIPPASYEPFPQSIQSKWLASSWKYLTLPKLDVLPGIGAQTRLAIGPEDELVIPVFVLQMRGLCAQGRLEAWIKIIKLGRSFYMLFPINPQWKDAWEDIRQFSAKMLKQERKFYEFFEKIAPAEKMRLFNERAMHVGVEPALVDPWNPQWTDPELGEFVRQKPYVGVSANPVYVFGSTTNQEGSHPRIPYAQDGSRVDSPMITQPDLLMWPHASAPFQSPLTQEQSIFQPAKIAASSQAPNHAQAIPLADQTPPQINPVPTALPPLAPVRKRKSRASKKGSASNKKLQTDKGQGDKLQQEMVLWLKELEKTYLANQAEIDAYYLESPQQVPTPPIDTSPGVSQVPPPPQAAPPLVNAVPQVTPPQQKKSSPVFNPTQESQKTVYLQMLARNAAFDKRLELPDADHIIVGGIDIMVLLDAGTDMMKMIKQTTPFMTDPALVVEQPTPETQQPPDYPAEEDILPGVPSTCINAPEHGWNNVEVIDESDVRFWPGMDNIYDVYLAEQGRKSFPGETKAEREEWEAHVAAEYQREMEKLDDMFGKDTY